MSWLAAFSMSKGRCLLMAERLACAVLSLVVLTGFSQLLTVAQDQVLIRRVVFFTLLADLAVLPALFAVMAGNARRRRIMEAALEAGGKGAVIACTAVVALSVLLIIITLPSVIGTLLIGYSLEVGAPVWSVLGFNAGFLVRVCGLDWPAAAVGGD